MSHLDETAYPQLKAEPTAQELEAIYTPTAAEKRWVSGQYQRQQARTFLLIQLKLLQRLGYVPALATVPSEILPCFPESRPTLYFDVCKAAQGVVESCHNPTVDTVRVALGNTGSKGTIAPLLKRWRAEHQGARSSPGKRHPRRAAAGCARAL